MSSLNGKRRTRQPGRMDGGASWISYSDMMAAMLLIFVLILCYSLFQYYNMLDSKTNELAAQQTVLENQETQINTQSKTLDEREGELRSAQIALLQKEQDLLDLQTKLDEQADELAASRLLLAGQKMDMEDIDRLLKAQQQLLDSQQQQIDTFLGVRTQIIQDLIRTFADENIHAAVDPDTGNITIDSAVFFDSNKADIKETGKALLNRFIPTYLNVLLRPEYHTYLGSIIIEGHTDTQGTYLKNMDLSQKRALAVITYCLNDMPGLSTEQKAAMEKIVTPTGRSFSSPVFNPDGTVNMIQSRRVEFKFSLKDTEMIEEINQILVR